MSIDMQAALARTRAEFDTVAAGAAEQSANLNALSLQVDSLSAANIGLQAQLDTANQTIAAQRAEIERLKQPAPPPPPPPPPAPTRLDVRTYGAQGNGVADDTLAIQKAIDASKPDLPAYVPAGRYLINSLRVPASTSFYGLLVGAGKRLECDPNAIFVVKPNSAPKNMCIRIDGGTMVDGQVLGDRFTHTFAGTTTHEWGYGVQMRGAGSKALGVKVSQCTGDGFGISGSNVLMEDCESDGNRRQGMSVFTVNGFTCRRSKFTNTGELNGQAGTNPRCGVDIEPDQGVAENILFEDCTIWDNDVTGFVAWIRDDVPTGVVRGLTVRNCKIGGKSPNAVHTKAFNNSITAAFEGCQIKRGSGSGMRIETGSVLTVNGNTFSQPTDRTDREVTGTSTATANDIRVFTGGRANVGTNRYV